MIEPVTPATDAAAAAPLFPITLPLPPPQMLTLPPFPDPVQIDLLPIVSQLFYSRISNQLPKLSSPASHNNFNQLESEIRASSYIHFIHQIATQNLAALQAQPHCTRILPIHIAAAITAALRAAQLT